ncbi:heterokaryon incompatibility protein-domain-containing protein [Xylaria longipes]|nr:heterokaryon incompatibility protein-domain-containing protein [Xylaria longipes]
MSMDDESPKYKHQQLVEGNYFRLLTLEPGIGEDPLVASLRTVELRRGGTEDRFEAISYVWGSDTRDQIIIIDGKPFPITSSLRNTLRQIRSLDKPRNIWADSVCIDQENNKEKSHQVAAMGRIYETSECTLICLGSEPKFQQHASDAAALIREVDEMIESVLYGRGFSGAWDSFPHPDADDPFVNDPRWKSWGELMNCPWFHRGWVIQEAALGPEAKILVYSWLAYRASPQMRSSGQFWLSPLHMQRFKIERPDEDKTFRPEGAESRVGAIATLEILDYARQMNLSDPRDRIYAFMALPTEDKAMSTLQPDYEAHYLDVYQDFAVTYLNLTSDLDILLYVESNQGGSLSESHLAS